MRTLLQLVLVALVLAAAAALWRLLMATAPEPPKSREGAFAPRVEVLEARPADRPVRVTAHGELLPARSVVLTAEVAARVVWVSPALEIGGVAEAGEPLVRLDATDLRAQRDAAAARLEQARSTLVLEQAAADAALAEWRRVGSGEPSDLVRREPQLAAARAAVAAAEAALALAENAVAKCEVRAPFPCRTEARLVEVGALAAPGAPLARLQHRSEWEARLVLSLADAQLLGVPLAGATPPLPVEVVARLGSATRTWPAVLSRIEPSLDPASRELGARAVLRLGDGLPTPNAGLFVTATVTGPTLEDVVTLPRAALRPDDRVLVVEGERLHARPVTLAAVQGDEVLVRGLAPGTRVCLTPLSLTAEGMRVVVAEGPTATGR